MKERIKTIRAIAFFPCGDADLEILESTTPDGPIARYIEKNGVELRPGVKEILEYLTDKKITVAIATATDYERTCKYLA